MAQTAAFYINIDRRTDRREHIEGQLAQAGITAERVSAITPADIAPERLAATRLRPTELACSLSHQTIWRTMLDRGLSGALIIEDDALLSRRIPEVLAEASLDERIDAIQLESHPSNALVGPAISVGSGVSIRRLMSSSLGTCAYYITARLAARLLDQADLDSAAVDKLLFGRSGATIYQSRIYQSVPALAIQLGLYASADAGVGRSDLDVERLVTTGGKPSSVRDRWNKLAFNGAHALRILRAFAPSGELWGARQMHLPIAEDLRAQLDTQGP
jgi:GR25 family glycosyltransferase involved in LPS biosynthesis